MRTFNYLQDKGIIFNKRGIGYYVAEDGFTRTLELKKDQFITEDLPAFFKMMRLLGITVDDLKKYYSEYDQNHK
jgi:DNA-binding transcriptional regulator YhcF (GntR family)